MFSSRSRSTTKTRSKSRTSPDRKYLGPLLLLATLALALPVFPSLVPSAHALAGTSTVFVAPSFQSTVAKGVAVNFWVNVSGMPQFNGFDILVKVDNTQLTPASITCATTTDPTCKGMIFTAPFPDINCVNAGAGITLGSPGNIGCTAQDGPGIAHSEIFCNNGCTASGSGLLFNVTFTGVSKTGQSVVDVYNDQILSAGALLPHVSTGAFYGSSTAVPDFTIAASPFSQVIPQGRTGSVAVTLASVNGFAGTVTLNTKTTGGLLASPLPVSLSSSSVLLSSGGTAMVTATVSPTASNIGGAYDLIVNGTATTTIALIHPTSVGITVTVPGFKVAITPSDLGTIFLGSSASATVNVTSINTFSGTVDLVATIFSSVKSPPVISFTPASVSVSSNGFALSTMMLSTTASTNSSAYSIQVKGTSGSSSVTNFVTINIEPVNAKMGIGVIGTNSKSVIVPAGNSNSTTVNVKSINGFFGNVPLSATVSPVVTDGPTASFSPVTADISVGGNSNVTITISTTPLTKALTYTFTVSGTLGPISNSTSVSAIVVPNFLMKTSPTSLTVTAGSFDLSTVTLTSAQGFSGKVNVTATLASTPNGLKLLLTNSTFTGSSVILTLTPGGTLTAILNVTTTSSTPAGSFAIMVSGANATIIPTKLSQSNSVSLTVKAAKPDFSIAGNPLSLTIQAGSSGTSMITLNSVNKFNGTVALSTVVRDATGAASSALTTSFTPFSSLKLSVLAGGTNSTTLNILSTSSTPAGTYSVNVTDTSMLLSHYRLVSVDVVDFGFLANTTSLTIIQGAAHNVTIGLTSLNGFAGTVNLAWVAGNSTLLGHPTATLNVTSVTLIAGGSGGAQLKVSTTLLTPVGFYFENVTATSGGLVHKISLGVNVVSANARFDLDASVPSPSSFDAGGSATSTITLRSINGFAGTVSLSATVSPTVTSGPTTMFSPATVTLTSSGPSSTGTSTLTISTTAFTPNRTYTITFMGASGLLHNSTTTVTFTVTPNFTLTATPVSSFLAGNSAASTLVLGSFGLTGNVILTPTPPSANGFAVKLNVTSVSLVPGGSGGAKLTITTTASTPNATYTISVKGAFGLLSHTATISVTVTADFAVTPSAATPSSFVAGSSATTTILLRSMGFTGRVALLPSIPTSATGASTTLNVTVISLVAGGSGGALLTLFTAPSTPSGTYSFGITGTNASLVHSVSVTVTVNADLSVAATVANPSSFIGGASSTSTVTIASLGFTGAVSLSTSVPTATGLTASLGSTSVSLTPGSTGTSSLQVSTTSSTPSGTYSVNVTATSGAISHKVTVTVGISAQPTITSVSVSLSSPTIGQVVMVTVTVANSGTSDVNVTLVVNWGSITEVTKDVTLPHGQTQTFTLSWDTTGSAAGSDTVSVIMRQDGAWNASKTGPSLALSPATQPFFTSTIIAVIGGVVAVVVLAALFLLLRRRKPIPSA